MAFLQLEISDHGITYFHYLFIGRSQKQTTISVHIIFAHQGPHSVDYAVYVPWPARSPMSLIDTALAWPCNYVCAL
jgi:hypothetical protein